MRPPLIEEPHHVDFLNRYLRFLYTDSPMLVRSYRQLLLKLYTKKHWICQIVYYILCNTEIVINIRISQFVTNLRYERCTHLGPKPSCCKNMENCTAKANKKSMSVIPILAMGKMHISLVMIDVGILVMPFLQG